MAPKLFETDSDDDSIRTDYTTQDDGDDYYDVEKILAQKGSWYLIKWVGYPTTEATWEPRQTHDGQGLSGIDDESDIFVEWRRHLKAVRDGREKAFDLTEWATEWETHRKEKNEKRARRNAKRRKKDLPTRPDTLEEENPPAVKPPDSESEEESEDEPLAIGTANARPPPKQPVHRKGVAQKLKKRRHEQQSDSSSSQESSEVTPEDSEDSLMEEMSSRKARIRPSPVKRPPRPEVVRKPSQTSSVVPTKKQRISSSSTAQPAQGEPRREKQTQQRPPAPMRTLSTQSDVRRKSVPNSSTSGALPARAKKSKNVMSNWDADNRQRKRVTAIGSLTAETAPGRFLHLRMQNEVQKSGRVEAAPDVSALNIIDPKTGKVVVPSKVKGSVLAQEGGPAKPAEGATVAPRVTSNTPPATVASGIHGVYARRSPPPGARTRDATPLRSVSGSTSVAQIEKISERQHSTVTDEVASSAVRGFPTCSSWLQAGDATKLSGEYASRMRLPPQGWVFDASQLRCHFFRTNGTCRMGSACRYAHYDTGYDAPPPGISLDDARASQAAFATTVRATKISGQVATHLRLPPPEWSYNAGLLFCHFFRTHGNCRMGGACRYAHNDTGYDAPPPGVTIEEARSSQAAYKRRLEPPAESASTAPYIDAAPTAAASEAISMSKPMHEPMSRDTQKIRLHPDNGLHYPRRLTCHFWRTQNSCTKGDSCLYSHFDTGFDALPPRNRMPSRAATSVVVASAPNANMEPMGNQRWTSGTDTNMTVQSIDRPAFSEPQYAKMPGPSPLQTEFPLSSDVVMPPGLMTVSPMHTSLSDSRRMSATVHSLSATHDTSTGLVTRNAILKLYHQGSERPHHVRLKVNVLGDQAFTRLIGDEPSMRVEHAISTSDVKALLWDDIQHSSNAAAGTVHMDIAPEHEMSGLAELCKLHDCGLLAAVQGYSANVLIYPSNAEQWKFLEAPGLLSGGGASLKLYVFDGCPDIRGSMSLKAVAPVRYNRRSPAIIVGEALAQLERDRIFPKDVDAVFLMIPPAHAAELEVLKRVFAGEARCKVYHSGTAGAWAYFCKNYYRSGVVLVNPEVPLWQIPKLHNLTLGSATFFTIGIDLPSAILNDHESLFECTRILPLGGAALLTDELITDHPEQATEIIQNFLHTTSCKFEGAEMNKIVARPGLKRFLLDFIERGRPDGRWLRLYGAVCDLCPPEDEDLDDPPNPLATSHLVSINPDLLPSFAGLWERNEHAANDLLVEWFAGWALLNASRFRKFVVITGTGTDDRGWAQKYQHIGVMSPDAVMKYVIRRNKPEKGVHN